MFTGMHREFPRPELPRSWKKTFRSNCLLSWIQKDDNGPVSVADDTDSAARKKIGSLGLRLTRARKSKVHGAFVYHIEIDELGFHAIACFFCDLKP